MDKIPILLDAEPETSMEQDEEDQIHKKLSTSAIAQNGTNTLFNITFEDLEEEKHESMELKSYENRLHQNMKDWKSLYHNAYKDLKQAKQKHPIVDKSILPQEKLEYLAKAEDLQSFIRESLEFRQQAAVFLEYDYAEFIEALENLETLYEHRLDLIKAKKIAENLANTNKNVD